jgi:hypothetical protein
MGGFLEGLTSLLGGFAAKKQIDADGFDYQQIRDQKRLEREQEAQRFQQANEDWATKAAAEADLGAAPGEDISSVVPGYVNKQSVLARARGAGLQTKSSLESQKAYNQQALAGSRDAASMEREKFKAEKRSELVSQLEQIRANQQISPAKKAELEMRISAQMEMFQAAESGRNARDANGGIGGRLDRSPATVDENGNAGTYTMNRRTGEREFFPSAPTATMRDTAGMAQGIQQSLDVMKAAAERGVTDGPIAGRLSKIWQAAYPSGNEGEFDAAANKLVDIVYTKSGKQINAQELKILGGLIPNRARGNIDFQIKQFEDYADTLLSKYPGMGQRSGAAPVGGKRKRFNPETGSLE